MPLGHVDVKAIQNFDYVDLNALYREDVVRFLCASLLIIDLKTRSERFLCLKTLTASKILYSCIDFAWYDHSTMPLDMRIS